MSEHDKHLISGQLETKRATPDYAGSSPHSQSVGSVARAFEATRTPRGGRMMLFAAAATVVGGLMTAGYNHNLKTGAEAAIKDALKAEKTGDKTQAQLVNTGALPFTNPLNGAKGTVTPLSKMDDGCFEVEVKGGDAQGMFGKYTTLIKGRKKEPDKVLPTSFLMKSCPYKPD